MALQWPVILLYTLQRYYTEAPFAKKDAGTCEKTQKNERNNLVFY